MLFAVKESMEKRLRNLLGEAVIDFENEAQSESDYWTEDNEKDCRNIVCKEFIEIINDEKAR